jgi:hypothetical protein
LVIHLICQMDTRLVEMQKIFWQEIITNNKDIDSSIPR